MVKKDLSKSEVAQLEKCWRISAEGEDLVRFTEGRVLECEEAIKRLAKSAHLEVRWQVYSALFEKSPLADQILRVGIHDVDNYARRRSILALAHHHPPDALDLARDSCNDSDPYIRQASIELIASASPNLEAFRMVEGFLKDPIEHVQRAAQRALDTIRIDTGTTH
jgi:HEAT repeat protein